MDGTRTGPTGSAAVRPLWGLIALLLVGYLGWLVWAPTSQPWRDLVLYTVILLACTVAVLLRARAESVDRRAWLLLGLGMLVWTASDALYTVQAQRGDASFPSVADWGYLMFFPFAYLAVGLLVVRHVARSAIGVWLDGILVALAAGSFLWLMVPELSSAMGTDGFSVFMQFATPASDLLLLSGLIGVVGLLGRQAAPMWWALVGAASFLWATDSIWLLGISQDAYHVGIPLDIGWIVAFLLFATAAWLPAPVRAVVPDRTWAPMAAIAGGASFLLLLFATQNRVPFGSVLLAAGAVVIGVVRGAQTMRAASAYQQARRQAERDELTGLANRRRLTTFLGDSERMPAGALLLIDIDRFKWVNDSMGHAAGDQVLLQLAPRLASQVGSDDLVVRLGGDEFAVFLAGVTDPDAAYVAAELLRTRAGRPMNVSGIELEMDLSIGIALTPRDAGSLSELLKAADGAMYRAKRSRMGSAVYEADDGPDDQGQLFYLQELRHALVDGQLTCVYQPKLDLRTGSVVGVEALMRWQHPERGEIPPGQFLPYAEHTAVIRPLTTRALDVALAQAAAWQRDGLSLTMSVNLSATNLMDPRLQATVMERLTKHGVPAGRLMLEVTESVFVEDPVRAERVIAALTDLGVRLSVDDYGTGFSSLGQIQHVATEELKLDSSFVIGVAQRRDLQAIVSATVLLAHGLGLTLVAEGVETQDDLDTVTRLGVDQAQGFHICPPLSPLDAERWLRSHVTLPSQRQAEQPARRGGPDGPFTR